LESRRLIDLASGFSRRRWRIRYHISILLILAFAGSAVARQAAEGTPGGSGPQYARGGLSLKIDVNLVTLDAVVRNYRGATAGELRPEDFTLYDNGVAQELNHFSQDQLPLAVAIVVDRSPSISPFLRQLRDAALSALQRLRPGDEVALFTFDLCPARLSDLTADRSQISHRMGEIRIGANTNIFGAIFNAAHYLRMAAPDRRRAIILISDNLPNVFHISEEKALREVLEAGVTLYSIRTRSQDPAPGKVLGRPMFRGEGTADPNSIERIAAQSGGEVLNLSNAQQFSQALDSAVLNLRLGYTLGFTPSHLGEKGSYHRLTVKLDAGQRCPGCQVQARAGYYVASEASLAQANSSIREAYDCEEVVAYNYLRNPYALVLDTQSLPFGSSLAETYGADGQKQVRIELRIAAGEVQFQTANGLHNGSLLIAIFCLDENGNQLDETWKRMDLELKNDDYKILMQSGITFSSIIPLKAPGQALRVFVYDLKNRRFGMKQVKIK
jgi:Ca-activated chloride channel family protein